MLEQVIPLGTSTRIATPSSILAAWDLNSHGHSSFNPFFPSNIFSEIKILFPDPWPKFKHKNRRLIQDNFLISLYNVLKINGIITLGTDHFIMKSWILEIFQNNSGFQWTAETAADWRTKPIHYVATKYEQKAINENRDPYWFIFKKILG